MVAATGPLSLRCVDLLRPDADATADLREACSTSGIFEGPTCYCAVPSVFAPADCHAATEGKPPGGLSQLTSHPIHRPHRSPVPCTSLPAVSNHGLEALIERHFEQTWAFFSLPMKRKMDIMIDSHHRRARQTAAPDQLP